MTSAPISRNFPQLPFSSLIHPSQHQKVAIYGVADYTIEEDAVKFPVVTLFFYSYKSFLNEDQHW